MPTVIRDESPMQPDPRDPAVLPVFQRQQQNAEDRAAFIQSEHTCQQMRDAARALVIIREAIGEDAILALLDYTDTIGSTQGVRRLLAHIQTIQPAGAKS